MLTGFLLFSAVQVATPKFTDNRVPDVELISHVEKQVVMPEGAGGLPTYDRAYTEAKIDGKDYVLGQMIDHRLSEMFADHGTQPLPPPLRRVLMKDIQPAFDGGCAILMLTYEVGSMVPPKVRCNPAGPH